MCRVGSPPRGGPQNPHHRAHPPCGCGFRKPAPPASPPGLRGDTLSRAEGAFTVSGPCGGLPLPSQVNTQSEIRSLPASLRISAGTPSRDEPAGPRAPPLPCRGLSGSGRRRSSHRLPPRRTTASTPGPGGPRGRGLRRPHTPVPTSSPRPGLGAEHTLTSGPCPGAANALTWTRVSQVWRDAGASSPADKVQPSLPQCAPCPGAPNPQGTHGGWDSLRLGARMKQLTVSAPPSAGRGPLSKQNLL